MSLKETLSAIENSNDYKKFIKEHPNAEICAGFFVIDFFGNDNKKSIDFKVGNKIFTFSINELGKIKMNEDKLLEVKDTKFPELQAIDCKINVDLDEISSIARVCALDEGISAKFSKIIAVLQKYEDKQVWNLTCMLEGLIILHILVNADSGDIIKFERKSMMDLIKKK